MLVDINGREIHELDWVKLPDDTYPFTVDPVTPWRYGTRCRHAQVTRAYSDGTMQLRVLNMWDMRNVENGAFQFNIDVYGNECLLVKNSEGLVNYNEDEGGSTPEVQHVVGERVQPRDGNGRYMAMDYEAPIIIDDDPSIANDVIMTEWLTMRARGMISDQQLVAMTNRLVENTA